MLALMLLLFHHPTIELNTITTDYPFFVTTKLYKSQNILLKISHKASLFLIRLFTNFFFSESEQDDTLSKINVFDYDPMKHLLPT